MASDQVKIEKGLHEEVKDFVDKSEKYSRYKAFYEEAARKELEKQKNKEKDFTVQEIKEKVMEDLDLNQ